MSDLPFRWLRRVRRETRAVHHQREARVRTDDEQHLEELAPVEVVRQALPRAVADPVVVDRLVHCAKQRTLARRPDGVVGTYAKRSNLLLADPGCCGDAFVLGPFVRATG